MKRTFEIRAESKGIKVNILVRIKKTDKLMRDEVDGLVETMKDELIDTIRNGRIRYLSPVYSSEIKII